MRLLQTAYAGPFAQLPRNALTRAALIVLRAFIVVKARYGAALALALLASPPLLRAALA